MSVADNLTKDMKRFIIRSVREEGKHWKAIAQEFKKRYPNKPMGPTRLGEIYEYYLDPLKTKYQWSEEEEMLLISGYERLTLEGEARMMFRKLKMIYFPNRCRNDIKNKYYSKFKEYLARSSYSAHGYLNSEYDISIFNHVHHIICLFHTGRLPRNSHLASIIKKEQRRINGQELMKVDSSGRMLNKLIKPLPDLALAPLPLTQITLKVKKFREILLKDELNLLKPIQKQIVIEPILGLFPIISPQRLFANSHISSITGISDFLSTMHPTCPELTQGGITINNNQ